MEHIILPFAADITFNETDKQGNPVTRTVEPIVDDPQDSGKRLYVLGTLDAEGNRVLGDVVLKPWVPTPIIHGIAVAADPGHDTTIAPRSSAMTKRRIGVTLGTVDNGYSGEIVTVARYEPSPFDDKGNFKGAYPITVKYGERISQLIERPVNLDESRKVEALRETARGANGWGSTDPDRQQAVATAKVS